MENCKSFAELGLSEDVLDAINKKGFEEPTAIQAMTIPVMLKNTANIIAQAQTGTGKTAAFGLPLIQLIDPTIRSVQAIILVPTRELAIQVSEEINSIKGKSKIKVVPIYGGQAIDQQLRRLKNGVHIVVGSPGRVIDHLNRKTLKLEKIEHLILDEADEMLNMGFIEDIEEIMTHTNPDKKTLLFSATMPRRIKELAKKYMDGYELLAVKKSQLVTNLTEQIYFEVKMSDKFDALCRIIDIEDGFYGLVFCRTKSDVDFVTSHLIDRGYDAGAIHGDISQAQREKILARFKKKKIFLLIATDVAARGIDVNDLTHVINYSLPHDPESYVHRIGRTGRAGKQGTAITFITPSEYKKLMYIKKVAKTDIRKSKVPKVKEIIDAKKRKIASDLQVVIDNGVDDLYSEWANNLIGDNDPKEVLSAFLKYNFEDILNPQNYGEIAEIGDRNGRNRGDRGGRNDRGRSGGRGRMVDQSGKARLFIALGKKDKVNAKKLVEMILDKVPFNPRLINDVQVMDKFSFVTVPFDKAEQIIESTRVRGKRPLISMAKR